MNELACQFGDHRRLAGILTEPAAPAPAAPAPAAPGPRTACVLVNAGLVPKSGPFRLYTELARRLAQGGVVTLRFDLGGIGDSFPELSGRPLRERTAAEIRAAVEEVRRRYPSLSGLAVGGLCSGAEDALRYAEQDPGVTGVVMIDPFSYRTAGWQWRYLAYRAVRRSLRAAGLYEPIVAAPAATVDGTPRRVVNYRYMEHAESSRILKALIAREARVHFIYTGGQQDSFNHKGQLARMFEGIPFEGRVTVDYFAHMDHTQLLDADRRTVADAIGAWLGAR
jgi:alpha-beta hydrolase superfamily lysophospholipase